MAAVAAHPVPLNTERRRCGIEALPQIDVLHRLAVGRLPLAAVAVAEPFADDLTLVLRVGGDRVRAGPRHRREPGDGVHELHAVVGGEDLGAGYGLLLAFIP